MRVEGLGVGGESCAVARIQSAQRRLGEPDFQRAPGCGRRRPVGAWSQRKGDWVGRTARPGFKLWRGSCRTPQGSECGCVGARGDLGGSMRGTGLE